MGQSAPVQMDARWTTAPVWSCQRRHCLLSVSRHTLPHTKHTRTHTHTDPGCLNNIRQQSPAPPSGPCLVQCMNGGSCFLNAHKQPKCRCQPNYGGDRCEIDQCRDYCKNGGTCTPSPTGKIWTFQDDSGMSFTKKLSLNHSMWAKILLCRPPLCFSRRSNMTHPFTLSYVCPSTGSPTCRCLTGFTGPNCDLHTCKEYCKNGGNCTVSIGNQPICRCPADFLGDQCQYSECSHRLAQV